MNSTTTTDWPYEYNFSRNFSNLYEYGYDPGFELKHGLATTAVLCLAYTIVFVLGLLGNGFVVLVVLRSPRMRSPTNLFIMNLACADLLINVLCLPFTFITNLIPAWILGSAICKGVAYFQGVSVSASINTLMAISLERCKAISSPLSGAITFRTCRFIVTLIWIFALSINLPWIVVFTLEPLGIGSKAQICTELWPSEESENLYFVLANLIVCYLLPLFVISACYIQIWRRVSLRRMPGAVCGQLVINRSKVKVVKMLFVVVVTFALSWLPLYVLFCIIKFRRGADWNGASDGIVVTLIPITQWLGASNSCINPIIYAFFNRKFRAGFKAIVTSKSCCGPLPHDKYANCSNSTWCHNNSRNRTIGVSVNVARKDKENKRAAKKKYSSSIYNIESKMRSRVSSSLMRSRSANADCRCLHRVCKMGERSRSETLLDEMELSAKMKGVKDSKV